MIYVIGKTLENIKAAGKNFKWVKIKFCPVCGSVRVWGHGFVGRYFDQPVKIMMKRARCNDCKTVFTFCPIDYFSRFQKPVDIIFLCILHKLFNYTWSNEIPRQNQQYWYTGFKMQSNRILKLAALLEILIFFYLHHRPFCTNSSKYHEEPSVFEAPHHSFAFT